MAVAPVSTKTVYALSGTNVGPFDTVWPYEAAGDVQAWLTTTSTPALLSAGTDYTLAGASPLTDGGQVTLNAALHGAAWPVGASLSLLRKTAVDQPSTFGEALGFSPAASEQALDHVARQVQDLERGVAAAVEGGVSSVAGRTGDVSLTAADVLVGFNTQVAAALAAGTGIALTTLSGITRIDYTGGGGGGAVSSVAGRTGAVTLAATDVASGFGTQMYGNLVAGSGIGLGISGGVITISNTGAGAVASVAGRTGAVTLTAADVASGLPAAIGATLAGGTGISVAYSSGVTTITNTGSGGVTSVASRTGAVTLTAADVSSGFGAAVAANLAAGPNVSLSTSGGTTTISAAITGGGATTTTYVGSTTGADFSATSQAISLPVGANTGDLAILIGATYSGSSPPTAPAGWATLYSGISAGSAAAEKYLIAWKVLTSTDVTAGSITVGGYPTGNNKQALLVYRGPNNVSLVEDQLGVDPSPITLAGFVKQASNIGTLVLVGDATGGVVAAPTGPTSFTGRLSARGGVWDFYSRDMIGGSSYTNGTALSIAFTPVAGGYSFLSAWLLELRNDGTGGGGGAVSSVSGRTGAVSLTAADVASGFGTAVAGVIAAGSGVTLTTSSGVTTIAATGGGGGGAVSSVNGRAGTVSLTASDVSSGFGSAIAANLAAGSGIGLATSGGVTTISATGGSAVPYGYQGAWENGVTTGNVAATNVTNLNAQISTLHTAGGGTIWFNVAGPYQIDGTIHLKSNVGFRMAPGAYFSWVGGSTGDIFATAITDVLINTDLEINLNEGAGFNGVLFNIHSALYCTFRFTAYGGDPTTGNTATFLKVSADSTAGEPTSTVLGGRNHAFCNYYCQHVGAVGYGLVVTGITSGFAGQPQGVTLNTFYNLQLGRVWHKGVSIDRWADSNSFTGNTYIGLGGSDEAGGAIGISLGVGAAEPSVYNIYFQHVAIDTFGTVSPGRQAWLIGTGELFYCDGYFQDPAAEIADDFSGAASYQIRRKQIGSNNIYIHTKGVSTGL